jgi:hypothetical protein
MYLGLLHLRGEDMAHWYNVAILSYSSPKTRAMAQRGEGIAMSGRIRVQVTYRGSSWREARQALGLAIVKASRLRLAYGVHVLRDFEVIIQVNVEHL